MAYFVRHHAFEPLPSLCPISSVSLYSWSLAWLPDLWPSSLMAFLVVDALFAAAGAITFHLLLLELAKSRLIAFGLALTWVLVTNHPIIINAGFINAYGI